MKRLRTLSIARIEALNRRNYASAWGGSYWFYVNARKRREWERRRWRHVRLVPLVPVESLPGETPIAEAPATPVVH